MDFLDKEYRLINRSWKSYAGSLGLTGLLFFSIASTRFGFSLFDPDTEPELSQFYLPPPPSPTPKPLTLPSKSAESIDFKIPDEEEDKSEEEPEEKIVLDFLDISFGPGMKPSINVNFDLRAKLRAVKPHILDKLIVYERDQVDERPVRIYAPNPSLDQDLREEGAELVVLYRVKKDGKTEDILLLDSTNEKANPHARRIIKGSRFRPARKNGVAVNVWVQHRMIFKHDQDNSAFSYSALSR